MSRVSLIRQKERANWRNQHQEPVAFETPARLFLGKETYETSYEMGMKPIPGGFHGVPPSERFMVNQQGYVFGNDAVNYATSTLFSRNYDAGNRVVADADVKHNKDFVDVKVGSLNIAMDSEKRYETTFTNSFTRENALIKARNGPIKSASKTAENNKLHSETEYGSSSIGSKVFSVLPNTKRNPSTKHNAKFDPIYQDLVNVSKPKVAEKIVFGLDSDSDDRFKTQNMVMLARNEKTEIPERPTGVKLGKSSLNFGSDNFFKENGLRHELTEYVRPVSSCKPKNSKLNLGDFESNYSTTTKTAFDYKQSQHDTFGFEASEVSSGLKQGDSALQYESTQRSYFQNRPQIWETALPKNCTASKNEGYSFGDDATHYESTFRAGFRPNQSVLQSNFKPKAGASDSKEKFEGNSTTKDTYVLHKFTAVQNFKPDTRKSIYLGTDSVSYESATQSMFPVPSLDFNDRHIAKKVSKSSIQFG